MQLFLSQAVVQPKTLKKPKGRKKIADIWTQSPWTLEEEEECLVRIPPKE